MRTNNVSYCINSINTRHAYIERTDYIKGGQVQRHQAFCCSFFAREEKWGEEERDSCLIFQLCIGF